MTPRVEQTNISTVSQREPIASLLQVKNYENQRKLTQPLKDGGAKQVRARDVVVSNPTYMYLLRRFTLFLPFFF